MIAFRSAGTACSRRLSLPIPTIWCRGSSRRTLDMHDLEVTSAGLEEAFLAITEAQS